MSTLLSVTPPSEEPITLDQAKNHLRVDIEDDDGLIDSLIKVSREYAEAVTGRALITQTWKMYLTDWPEEDYIELPYPPLQSISSITYEDYNGTVTTWAATHYKVDTYSEPGRVVLAYDDTWPTATLNVSNPICITFVCGYGTPDDIPESIKAGMKIDLSDLYDNRASIVIGQAINHLSTVDRLYAPCRTFKF